MPRSLLGKRFQAELTSARYGVITTEIAEIGTFYDAEPDHQQHPAANWSTICGGGGRELSCASDSGERVTTGVPAGQGAEPGCLRHLRFEQVARPDHQLGVDAG